MWWARMKRDNPSLYGALQLGLFVNVLLRAQTLFWTREGLATLLSGILVTAAAGLVFARVWPLVQCRLLRWAFIALLLEGSVLDILSLWQLYVAVYPDVVSLFGICLTVLIPVAYLRRVSAIAQTANVVLGLLLAACVVLVLSVAERLRVVNLQTVALDAAAWRRAMGAQCTLYPELLLPALWPDHEKRGSHTVMRLAVFGAVFNVGVHLLLELFFGAAMPDAENPLHQAARCGALSVFDRLEWLQLIVWTMAVSVKLALHLYAVTRLAGGPRTDENSLTAMPFFAGYLALMLLLCAVAKNWDFAMMSAVRNAAAWGFTALAAGLGGIRWLTGFAAPKRA